MAGGVPDGWYRVTLPYMCCGVRVAEGKVTLAAPILRWAQGKVADKLKSWVEGKGGTFEVVGTTT